MSELTKNQLKQDNQNSFPNNNTGYITPSILRDFNNNMIDSLVDEVTYTADSASFNDRINTLDPSGSIIAINSLEHATASLNAFTASQYVTNSVFSGQIGALQSWSSSLDATYATDAQLSASASTLQNDINTRLTTASFNAYTASFTVTGYVTTASFNAYTASESLNTSASINAATQSLSSSVAAINATQLSTASFNSYTQSASSNVSASINAATQSLSSSLAVGISASIAQLSASSAATDAGQVSTASFNSYTSSASTNVSASINAATSSLSSSLTLTDNSKLNSASFNSFTASALLTSSGWASTGSNTFRANQVISGNLDVTGNITATSASFQYVKTVYETSSIIFSSGSNQLGDELTDVQTLSGSVKVQGSLTINGTAVITSSTDVTPFLSKSVFDTYTGSAATNVSGAINAATQSLSSSLSTGISASLASLSASLTLTDNTKLTTASFNSLAGGQFWEGVGSGAALKASNTSSIIIPRYVTTSSFEAYTSSAATNTSASINSATASLSQSLSASIGALSASAAATDASQVSTASFNSYTASAATNVSGAINTATQSLSSSIAVTTNNNTLLANQKLDTGSFNTYTASASTNVSASINSATQSLSSSIATTTAGLVQTTTFNSYTASASTNVSGAINTATGSSIVTASAAGDTITFTKGNGSTFPVTITIATGSLPAGLVSSSAQIAAFGYATTSSVNSLSQSVAVTTLQIDGKLSTSSFETYTASAASNVSGAINSATSSLSASLTTTINGISSKTGSYITSAQTSSMSVLSSSYAVTASYVLNSTQIDTGSFATTGSNTFKGNQIISGNLSVSGNISATSASFQYVQTVFETASIIYSSGSNQFGDAANDVQTLYGSVNVVNQLTASGLRYPTTDGIFPGQVLQTDAAGNLSFGNVNAVFEGVFNGEATTITKGTALYVSGANGSNPIVYRADTSNPAKMPVAFVAMENIGTGAVGRGITLGLITGIDMTGYPVGTELWTDGNGTLTSVRPTGSNDIVQPIGIVTKTGNGGQLNVLNPGPVLLPNIQSGYIWVGDSTNQAVSLPTSSFISSSRAGEFVTTSSFNSYTQSAASNTSASINSATQSLSQSLSSSIGSLSSSVAVTTNNNTLLANQKLDTGSFNTYTASASTNVSASINSATQSLSSSIATTTAGLVQITTFNSYTASAATNVSGAINVATQSLSSSIAVTTNNNTLLTNQKLDTGSFNTYTSSAATNVSGAINVATQSLSSSIATTTSNITLSVNQKLDTGSFNTYTASAATNVSGAINTATQSLSSSIATTTANISSSLGSVSASNAAQQTQINSLISATGSYITSAQTSSMTVLSSSYSVTASFALNAGTPAGTVSSSAQITAFGFANTGSNNFVGNQKINGNVEITGSSSYPSLKVQVTDFATTGSFVSNIGQNQDTNKPAIFYVVNVSSASMASLLAGPTTNPNTIYFVV